MTKLVSDDQLSAEVEGRRYKITHGSARSNLILSAQSNDGMPRTLGLGALVYVNMTRGANPHITATPAYLAEPTMDDLLMLVRIIGNGDFRDCHVLVDERGYVAGIMKIGDTELVYMFRESFALAHRPS